VIGSRGHGTLARLVAGSVSRRVAQGANCPVLVVRDARTRRRSAPRRFAVGFDGSANSRRAIRFIARLHPPRRNRVVLISVLQSLSSEHARAQVQLQTAARWLRARGWHPATIMRSGAPVDELLDAARSAKSQVIAVGAAGSAGLERFALGSVASGILNRSPLPVLIVR
jgi:nucleotide-binding universal stress UspA family protein